MQRIWVKKKVSPAFLLNENKFYPNAVDEQFRPLVDGGAKERAEKFVAGDHTFYEGVKEIDYYKDFAKMISEIPKNMFFGRIYFNNDDIISELQDRCETSKNIIISELLRRCREHNKE